MDILDKKLRKGAEKFKTEPATPSTSILIDKSIEVKINSFWEEKDEFNGLGKVETLSFRSLKAIKVALEFVEDFHKVNKKCLLEYLILKLFVDAWEKAPEEVKNYYLYNYPELPKIYETLKKIIT